MPLLLRQDGVHKHLLLALHGQVLLLLRGGDVFVREHADQAPGPLRAADDEVPGAEVTLDEIRERLLALRGVENPCPRCGGVGKYSYPSTSGWRGGCAGMTPTTDVCDKCWGSGDAGKPWINLRLVESLLNSHGELLTRLENYVRATARPYHGELTAIDRAHSVEAAFGRKRR